MNKPARHFVRVCVFILPGANMANNRLEEEFRIAREVWGFDFNVTVLKINHPLLNNLSSRDFACEGREDTEVEHLLFELARTYCPDPHTIAVFYTGTDSITGFTRACTKRRELTTSISQPPTIMNVIFISNLFAPDTLAHEIGHVFFFSNYINRADSDLTKPGIQPHVEGDPYNIMAPGCIRKFPTTATPEQINRAIQASSPRIVFDRNQNLLENFPDFAHRQGYYYNHINKRRPLNKHSCHPYHGQTWPGYFY